MGTDRNAIALETSILRISGVVMADLDGEIGMMHMDRGMYYAFNDVGTRIWQLLERPNTAGGIVAVLSEEYAVDAGTCREQVLEFLKLLYKNELINISNVE